MARLTGATLALALLTTSCSDDFDAGASPEEQLCTVLGGAIDLATPDDPFRLEPLVEGGVIGVEGAEASLAPVFVGYRSHVDRYDDLGPYEPAIRFAAAMLDPDVEGLLTSATPSEAVLTSARAVDAELRKGACLSER